MTLRELQEKICGQLNADSELLQAGCRAFAEDSLSALQSVATHLHEIGGVAAIVITPRCSNAGRNDSGELVVDIDPLIIEFIEMPEVNRINDFNFTALEAAQRTILLLEDEYLDFRDLSQSSDPASGSVTVSVSFACQITLTKNKE